MNQTTQSAAAPVRKPGALAQGTAAYFGATFFWGLNIPLTAVLLQTWDPFALAPMRVYLAAVTLVLFLMLTQGWRALSVSVSPWRLLLCSLAFASFLLLYNMGLYYCDPITAAAVMAGAPVYAAVVHRVVNGAALEKGFVVAATLTIIGAGIAISGRPVSSVQPGYSGGEIFFVLSFIGWNLYSIAQQRWFAPEDNALQRTTATFIVATGWLVIGWVSLWIAGYTPSMQIMVGAKPLVLLLITAVLATGMGVVLWNVGVGRIGLTTGALWQNTVPVFGVLIAAVLGFSPSAEQILGGIVVLCGVLWMQWHKMHA